MRKWNLKMRKWNLKMRGQKLKHSNSKGYNLRKNANYIKYIKCCVSA